VMDFALGYYNVPPDAPDDSGEATP
jgi:hypothetical protein